MHQQAKPMRASRALCVSPAESVHASLSFKCDHSKLSHMLMSSGGKASTSQPWVTSAYGIRCVREASAIQSQKRPILTKNILGLTCHMPPYLPWQQPAAGHTPPLTVYFFWGTTRPPPYPKKLKQLGAHPRLFSASRRCGRSSNSCLHL